MNYLRSTILYIVVAVFALLAFAGTVSAQTVFTSDVEAYPFYNALAGEHGLCVLAEFNVDPFFVNNIIDELTDDEQIDIDLIPHYGPVGGTFVPYDVGILPFCFAASGQCFFEIPIYDGLDSNTEYEVEFHEYHDGEYFGPAPGDFSDSMCTPGFLGDNASCIEDNYSFILADSGSATTECSDINFDLFPDDWVVGGGNTGGDTGGDTGGSTDDFLSLVTLSATATETSFTYSGILYDGPNTTDIAENTPVLFYWHLTAQEPSTGSGVNLTSSASGSVAYTIANLSNDENYSYGVLDIDLGTLIPPTPINLLQIDAEVPGDGDDAEPSDPEFTGEVYQDAVSSISGGIVPCHTARDCDFNRFLQLLDRIINTLLFVVAIPFAAILFAVAGFKYVFSGGNTKVAGEVKSMIQKVVIGLIIALAAWSIVKIILITLIDVPNFSGAEDLFQILNIEL
jgi:hypothetical protein